MDMNKLNQCKYSQPKLSEKDYGYQYIINIGKRLFGKGHFWYIFIGKKAHSKIKPSVSTGVLYMSMEALVKDFSLNQRFSPISKKGLPLIILQTYFW